MIADVMAGALLAILLLLFVPVLVLFVQIVAARGASPSAGASERPKVAVLIPAHDEAGGIAGTLATVVPQLRADDWLIVVADNCSDCTADIAKSCGADVIERHDPQRLGKGYALDFGVRYLEAAQTRPGVVIVIDADCAAAPGSIDTLARTCAERHAPVQALYLMLAPPGAGLKQRMAEFAWALRNQLRPLGAQRLGGPCQLMGTGMAFPWLAIARASLASGCIVEDMQLGLDLAMAGTPPTYCAAARVTSSFPTSTAAALAQRTRWEHGHLSTIATRGLPLLVAGIARRSAKLVAMALDLCVPPLASLLLLVCCAGAAAGMLAAAGGSGVPLLGALSLLLLMTATVLLAWDQAGRGSISLHELFWSPLYALAKIPIYVRVVTARQLRWIRTGRDDGKR